MHSLKSYTVMNVVQGTSDAHGLQAVKNRLFGAVLIACNTEKSIVVNRQP